MRYERLENFRQEFRWNSDSSIFDAEDNLIVHQISADGKDATVRHRFPRVLDQVAEHADEPGEINDYVPVVQNVFGKLNVLTGEEAERLLMQFVEQAPDGDRLA